MTKRRTMEVTMHPFQLKPVSRLALATDFAGGAALGRLMASVVGMLGRRNNARSTTVPQYEGHAWCDSLEQQVNSDVVNCRRPRF
jgi:hypothetical protein